MTLADIKSPKVDNSPSAHAAKVDIRKRVLETIGPGKARVFDGFAGSGKMFEAVWSSAAAYTGCDLKWQNDDRRMYAADSRRVLRSIDLAQFNVFDLDAYGSPYEQCLIIAARRPPPRAGELLGDRAHGRDRLGARGQRRSSLGQGARRRPARRRHAAEHGADSGKVHRRSLAANELRGPQALGRAQAERRAHVVLRPDPGHKKRRRPEGHRLIAPQRLTDDRPDCQLRPTSRCDCRRSRRGGPGRCWHRR